MSGFSRLGRALLVSDDRDPAFAGGETINSQPDTDSSQPPAPATRERGAKLKGATPSSSRHRVDISGLVERPTRERVFGGVLAIDQIGAAMAVCTTDGHLLALTPAGEELFERAALATGPLPLKLPEVSSRRCWWSRADSSCCLPEISRINSMTCWSPAS